LGLGTSNGSRICRGFGWRILMDGWRSGWLHKVEV
jgi:hypothetical protein